MHLFVEACKQIILMYYLICIQRFEPNVECGKEGEIRFLVILLGALLDSCLMQKITTSLLCKWLMSFQVTCCLKWKRRLARLSALSLTWASSVTEATGKKCSYATYTTSKAKKYPLKVLVKYYAS